MHKISVMTKKTDVNIQGDAPSPGEDFLGDIGGFELPELEVGFVDFIPADEMEETRYTIPKVAAYSLEALGTPF